MQDLESKFANFIREENVQDVFLIRPKTIVNSKILISKKHRSSTKIGQGWRVFCFENELKEGDIVIFQVDNDFIEPNIEVLVNFQILTIMGANWTRKAQVGPVTYLAQV